MLKGKNEAKVTRWYWRKKGYKTRDTGIAQIVVDLFMNTGKLIIIIMIIFIA